MPFKVVAVSLFLLLTATNALDHSSTRPNRDAAELVRHN